jgi:16S rRNA (cytidine1402-2'-O)-methyltransferase
MPKFKLDNTLPKNLPLLFKDRAKANPDVGLQASKDKDGKFQTFTYKTVYENVISFALALQEIGVVRGENIALISDAGMPGISDPGNILINELIQNNLEYTVVSGPSALINAFVLSGYDAPFTFVGFLSDNNTKRKEILNNLSKTPTSLIFYCSPHSIEKDLQDMYDILGNRKICVVREISKKFEEINFSDLATGYTGLVKGEFVVVIDKPIESLESRDLDKDLETLLEMGLSKNEASKIVAKLHGLKKNDVYQNAIKKD